MLLETTHRNVEHSGLMQVAKATIKATPKIFNFFADQTYANKPVAITRELVANAIDAHTAAGNPDPVEVWLPSEMDPVFRVRDRGIGMSEEFMLTRFMAYTDGSTKDQTNDQIGGFGIGSKSPFAYTDQFTIRSVHDGIVGVYTVFKDADDVPAIGLLARAEVDEPNGVEVSFPVETIDHATFVEAAQQALCYFDPLPIVHGATLAPPAYTARGKGWAIRDKAGSLGIIMGGVRYPITTTNLSYELRFHSKLKPLLEYGLDLTLPIGACGIALSREALSYDERTNASITAALEDMIDDIVETFSTIFDHHDSLWDATCALAAEVGDGYNSRSQLLLANAKWRGAPLDTTFEVPVGTQGTYWAIEAIQNRRRGSTKVGSAKWEYLSNYGRGTMLHAGSYAQLIVDDLPQMNKSRTVARIKAAVEATMQTKPTLVIRPLDGEPLADLLKVFGDPTDYVLTSDLEAPTVVRSGPRWADRPRVRMFQSDSSNGFNGYRLRNSEYYSEVSEVPYADQPVTGILVVLNNFEAPADFLTHMNAGLVDWDEVYFANHGDAAKLKGWQAFDDVFKQRLAEALAEYPELPQRLAVAEIGQFGRIFNLLANRRRWLPLTPTQTKTPFGRIVSIYDRYVAPLTREQKQLAPFVNTALPSRLDPEALISNFETKQKRANRLLQLLYYNLSNEDDLAFFLEIL